MYNIFKAFEMLLISPHYVNRFVHMMGWNSNISMYLFEVILIYGVLFILLACNTHLNKL